MSVTDFQTLREWIYSRNHLSTSYFAELVTYTPAGGAARPISAHIREVGQTLEEHGATSDVDRIEVLVSRDEADATTGGVAIPQHGDTITRAAAKDPDGRAYGFVELVEAHPLKQRLAFERPRVHRQGSAGQ